MLATEGYWQKRHHWSEKVYKLRDKEDLLLTDYGHEIIMAGIEGLGFVYTKDDKNYEAAIKIAEDANKIIERIGKSASGSYKSKGWKRAKCFYYRIKGLSERSDYEAADHLKKAYCLADESEWESMKVAVGINLGEAYLNLKKVDHAIKIFEESEKLALVTEPPLYRRRVNALIGIGKVKAAELEKEYAKGIWKSENVKEVVISFKEALQVYDTHIQDDPFLFFNIVESLREPLSHVEGVNNMLKNLEEKTADLKNLKKHGDWNLQDFTEIREQTESILDSMFEYFKI
jgi:tetratricopeptide (TPR) repeat protein